MRTQCQKNKEILMEEIEKLSHQPMTDSIAVELNTYRGALNAILEAESGWKQDEPTSAAYSTRARTVEQPTYTPEMDGDTELERIFMQIPADEPHMMALFGVLQTHMTQLAIMHRKMHDNLMNKFREVARN